MRNLALEVREFEALVPLLLAPPRYRALLLLRKRIEQPLS
jgi:hypothetical protein